MTEKYTRLIGSVIIGVSVMVGSFLIGSGVKERAEKTVTVMGMPAASQIQESPVSVSAENALLSINEAADYLNITTDELTDLIVQQTIERKSLNSYEAYRYIPYIRVNLQYKFSKDQLDKWIDYAMTSHYEYLGR